MISNPLDYLENRQKEMSNLTRYLNDLIEETPERDWNYQKFGKQVEAPVIDFLLEKGLLNIEYFKDQSDNKNATPDIIDKQYLNQVFIDVKAGNTVSFKTGRKVTSANQDLSTMTKWKNEIFKEFDGELCFIIEIKYKHSFNSSLVVEECIFDHFYKFVGKTEHGLISHRNRNVRPKTWDTKPQFRDSEEFKNLLDKTISYSIKNALFNGVKNLSDSDRSEIVDYLSKSQ